MPKKRIVKEEHLSADIFSLLFEDIKNKITEKRKRHWEKHIACCPDCRSQYTEMSIITMTSESEIKELQDPRMYTAIIKDDIVILKIP